MTSKKQTKPDEHMFIAKKKLAAGVQRAFGQFNQEHILFFRRESPYVFDLIEFYRTLKRKHVESPETIMDWANTALLHFWIDNGKDLTIIPDKYFIMAQQDPKEFKNDNN